MEPECLLEYIDILIGSLKHFLARLRTAFAFFEKMAASLNVYCRNPIAHCNTCVDTKLKQLTCIFSGDRKRPHVTCILGVKSGPQILQKG